MSAATLNLTQTAERVGLSAERWRKVWRTYVAELAFPAPLRCPSRRHQVMPGTAGFYAWDAAAVEAWAAARSRAGLAATVQRPEPAPPTGRKDPTLARERRELQSLMQGGL